MPLVSSPSSPYTLERAELDIANLRGLVDRLTEAHTLADSQIPNTPAAGITRFSLGGQDKYASPDGNSYNTGGLHLLNTGGQTISSTSDVLINGLTAPVVAGTYRFSSLIGIVCNSSTGTANISAHGPAVSSGGGGFWHEIGGATACNWTSLGLPAGGQGMTNAAVGHMHLEGLVTFSAAGTFTVQAHIGTASNTFTIQQGSYLDLYPVS